MMLEDDNMETFYSDEDASSKPSVETSNSIMKRVSVKTNKLI
jgi:hypothetical protein